MSRSLSLDHWWAQKLSVSRSGSYPCCGFHHAKPMRWVWATNLAWFPAGIPVPALTCFHDRAATLKSPISKAGMQSGNLRETEQVKPCLCYCPRHRQPVSAGHGNKASGCQNLRVQVFNGNEQVCSPALRRAGTIKSHTHYRLLFRSKLPDGWVLWPVSCPEMLQSSLALGRDSHSSFTALV